MIPTRIVASRQFPSPEGTFRISRPSRFGNEYEIVLMDKKLKLYSIQKDNIFFPWLTGERQIHIQAVEMFENIQMKSLLEKDPTYYDILLKYKHISCYCPKHLPCHCDPIIRLLERREKELTK